jgi:hypothetical protein
MIKKHALLLALVSVIFASCSKDEINENSKVIGSWTLTNYEIGVSVDIDKNGSESFNLLEELECENKEVLIFEANGTVSSNDTFNPNIAISKLDISDDYVFDVECAEGIISFATSYVLDNNTVEFSDKTSNISGNTLTRVFENAIEIYNEDFSEIQETRNLTLIYTKE